MTEDNNSNAKPDSLPVKRSLDPSSIVPKPKPQNQLGQGGDNQQPAEPASSESEAKQ